MRTLLNVSNRIVVPDGQAVAGGLDNTLVNLKGFDHVVRLGWSGETFADHNFDISHIDKYISADEKTAPNGSRITYIRIDLPENIQSAFYEKTANGDLWMLSHFRPDLMTCTDSAKNFYAGQGENIENLSAGSHQKYMRANEIFAAAAARYIQPDWEVLIHDYHLVPQATLMRQQGINNPLGFMMHIPMCDRETLMSTHIDSETRTFIEELYHRQLFTYDSIGLQAPWDLANWQDSMGIKNPVKLKPFETSQVHNPSGQSVLTGIFPACSDADVIHHKYQESIGSPELKAFLRNALAGRKHQKPIMASMDRLDISKGLPVKLQAIEKLLTSGRLLPEEIHLVQAAPAGRLGIYGYREELRDFSTNYRKLRSQFDNVVHTPHDKETGLPVSVKQGIMFGVYNQARVGVFTSMRDGQHLGPEEFALCTNPEDPGVILVTNTTGAAYKFTDAAIVVNPDVDAIADGMEVALKMSKEARKALHQKALAVIAENNNERWITAQVSAMNEGAKQRLG